MKSIRVALLTAGALTALVGGAETATWGLGPVAASLNATAPQIVASAGGPLDGAKTVASTVDGAEPPTLDTTPTAYSVSPAPPADSNSDGSRLDGANAADAASMPVSLTRKGAGDDGYAAEGSSKASATESESSARRPADDGGTATSVDTAETKLSVAGPD